MSLQYQVSYKEHIAKYPRGVSALPGRDAVLAAPVYRPPVLASIEPEVLQKAVSKYVKPKLLSYREIRDLGSKQHRD